MEAKACAIVMRNIAGAAQVLMFRHPLAGVQLVKGGVKAGETSTQAAARELHEESGLSATEVLKLTTLDFDALDQQWHICHCKVGPTPESWTHDTVDDDGQRFLFFWHPLNSPLPVDTGATYRKVLDTLQSGDFFAP